MIQNINFRNDRHLEICKSLLSDDSSKKLLDKSDVAKLLQACDNEKNTPLHLAAKANNKDIFHILLESGRHLKNPHSNEEKENNMYGIITPCNRTGRTPLLECAKHNRVSFMEELLTKDKSSKWKTVLDVLRDEDRMTCLHLACSEGKHETSS
jgi:ankyrin repeat protein